MNTKFIQWGFLFAGVLGSAASAFGAPDLLGIQGNIYLFKPNKIESAKWESKTGWQALGETMEQQKEGERRIVVKPPPPPSCQIVRCMVPWKLADLLFGGQILEADTERTFRIVLNSRKGKREWDSSRFPLKNGAAKAKFQRGAKANQYILDFGVIKQTSNPLEIKLVLEPPIAPRDQTLVTDFVFKIDASSPGAFSTELPLRDEKASDGSLLTIKGLVRGPAKPDDKAK